MTMFEPIRPRAVQPPRSYKSRLKTACKLKSEMLQGISILYNSNPLNDVKRGSKKFLKNPDLQALYSHEEAFSHVCKEASKRCLQHPPTYSPEVENRALQLASYVSPLTKQNGVGRFWLVFKSTQQRPLQSRASRHTTFRPRDLNIGGRRARNICSPASPTRVAYAMMADILQATFTAPCFIWDATGRGKEAMTKEISAVIEKGQHYGYVADVESSFESFNLVALRDILPLPNGAIDNLLNAGSIRWSRDYRKEAIANGTAVGPIRTHDTLQGGQGPIGLVTGGSCSNIIQSRVFSHIVQSIPARCTLFIYGDNLLVLGSNKRTVRDFSRRLEAWFAGSPFGPFLLHGSFEDARSSFDFVGYQHSVDTRGQAQRNLTGLNAERLPKRIVAKLKVDQRAKIASGSEDANGIVSRAVLEHLTGFSALSSPQDDYDYLCEGVWDEASSNARL